MHVDEDTIISIRHLVKTFTSDDGRRARVLDDVNLDIRRGETLVVMGGSGCGKSTLLNCLIGEYPPDEGQILYRMDPASEPIDIVGMRDEELNAIRKRFGILFQSGALFNSMTVAENVALPLREHSNLDRSIIDITVKIKLGLVRLLEHRDKMPSQLSGGQKKRAGLARAIAMDPQILFYDEPSAGLDPVTSAAIDTLIMDLSKKAQVTSVVVTHEMDSAFRVADRMVMLEKGRILRVGTRDEFDALRRRDERELDSLEDRLIYQFLHGNANGPLTDAQGLSEFEKLIFQD